MSTILQSRFSILFLSFLLIFSCKKDTDDNNVNNPPTNNTIWGQTVTTSISGRVLDQNGDPVSGAQVKAGGSNTTTDAMGVFSLTGVSAFKSLAYVTAEKTGYFPGSRSFVPSSSTDIVEIKLIPKTIAGAVSGTNGGAVNAQGVRVTLQPNSIVQIDNTPYNGSVNVSLAFIDPASPDFAQEMPGNLIGVQNNESQGLTSYGMVAVELTSNSGQKLQLAQGQTAEVRFPITATQQSTAPATIDLWSFEEVNGYWKHEGQATRSGAVYIAQVSHFSFWNCDIPCPSIVLDGLVKDSYNQPVQGATVTITDTNVGSASDITNTEGAFGGYVPSYKTLTINIYIDCGGSTSLIYTGNIGPFTTNTTLSTIVINSQNITTVSGTVVDCNNAPLVNSYVFANGKIVFALTGQFSFITCGSNVNITPFGTFPSVAGTSQTFQLNSSNVNIGNLLACNSGGSSTVTDIDGNTYNTVVIGTQEWMQENLKTTKYRDGSAIPGNLNDSAWIIDSIGAQADYNNDLANTAIYGKLYNWYAVADPRGLCPVGWHVPSDSEWTTLENFLGGASVAGGKMKAVSPLWLSPNTYATNSSGFSGLPGASRYTNGSYYSIGKFSYWWSSTQNSTTDAWFRYLAYGVGDVYRNFNTKSNGFSVRCVRD
jgi:uncharacterized protein (TIGR02145 family)